MAGARPDFLGHARRRARLPRAGCAPPSGAATRREGFRRGRGFAKAKLDLSEKATRDQWDTNLRPLALDTVYYDDFCSLSRWAQKEKLQNEPLDFGKLTWTDGLKAIDARRVDAPPPPC